ncbi:MAG: hypothetical protein NDI94_00515 [Candidatus Woesearchaeota archaeon]|nr:hypothetical protein [Candidatus Woesearchaeota archaeon]
MNTQVNLAMLPANLAELLFVSAEIDVKTLQMYINRHEDYYLGGGHRDRAAYHEHRYSPGHYDAHIPHDNYYMPKTYINRHEDHHGY